MNKEVEIQVIIKNPIEVEKKLKKIGKYTGTRKQTDKYFITPYRNFFKKDPPVEYLRIRFEKEKNHLNYSFLHFNKNNELISTDEYETLVNKPAIVEAVFKKVGLIHKITVIKTRKYFDCGKFKVSLDYVNNLGDFMEVEAKRIFGDVQKTRKLCLDFLKSLKVKYEIKTEMGYPRMLYRKLKKKKIA